ncbi:MAG: hypothetical protein AAF845_14685 [Bacteroidota bacterium]
MTSPAPTSITLTVLGHEGCVTTDRLRAALSDAGIPYDYSVLEEHASYEAGCSFTVPTVLVRGLHGGTRTFVQPDPVTFVADLVRVGVGPPSRPSTRRASQLRA